jgi:putative lipoprotein (rSAM/lipoprotein system)
MNCFKKKTARLQAGFYICILQILGICGAGIFTSCKYGDPVAEYGTPYPGNEIRFYGTVSSQDSLKNIPGITVRLVKDSDSSQTVTNNQGEFGLYFWAYDGDKMKIKVYDTDSAANEGYFKNKTVDVEISSRDVNNFERKVDVLLEKK